MKEYPTKVLWFGWMGEPSTYEMMPEQVILMGGRREGELVLVEGIGPFQTSVELEKTTVGEAGICLEDMGVADDEVCWVYDRQNEDGEGLIVVLG